MYEPPVAVGLPCRPVPTGAWNNARRTVTDVPPRHVSLEAECIDRMYWNVYQPPPEQPFWGGGFLTEYRCFAFASSVSLDPMTGDIPPQPATLYRGQ